MLKGLAFGLGVGAAIQAWRAFPPSLPLTADAVAIVFIVGLFAAYLGGRAGRGNATATATATAVAVSESTSTATQSVNLFISPGHGAGSSSTGVRIPSEHAPWLDGVRDRPALDGDLYEGMDLQELLEGHPDHIE